MPALKINSDGSLHVHSWIRGFRPDGKKDRKKYVCAHPDCITSMGKYDLFGKRSLCPICGRNSFILTHDDLKLSMPTCLDCSQNAAAVKIREKKKILETLLETE